MTNPKSPSTGDGATRPSGGLSRKSSLNVSYAEDSLSWTPELDAELDRAKAALRAANKKWSPEQEHWIPEVRICLHVKQAFLGGNSVVLQASLLCVIRVFVEMK